MMDEWQRRMKEEKEKERLKQKESAEMLQGYRGNDIREEDKKLKAMKEEERKKQQETAKILQGYRSSGMSEEERKLKAMKEEERKKHLEAESLLHSFKKTEEPDAKARPQRREEQSYPEPVNKSPSQQNDMTYISPGSVAERKKSFSSQYQPPGSEYTASPRSTSLQGVPFMEVVNEGEIHGDIDQYRAHVGDETKAIDSKHENPEETVETEVEPTASVEPEENELETEEYAGGTAEEENEQRTVTQLEAQAAGALQYTVEGTEAVQYEPTKTDEAEAFNHTDDEAKKDKETTEAEAKSPGQGPVEDRFDVYFSFGIITDKKGSPTLGTYMDAVREVIQQKIPNDNSTTGIRYDTDYQPYVIDEKTDNNYFDTRNRPDIRRLIITAAVPLMLSSEVSKGQAQQVATSALAEAIQSQTFFDSAGEKLNQLSSFLSGRIAKKTNPFAAKTMTTSKV